MNDFEIISKAIFSPLECCHHFKKTTTNRSLILKNKICSVKVCYDNYFEVNTYISFFNISIQQDINLISLSRYMDLNTNVLQLISSNQISDDVYLIKYLRCVQCVLFIVLDLYVNNRVSFDTYIDDYLENELKQKQEKQILDIVSLLNNLWHEKDYSYYLEFFEKNKELIEHNKEYFLAKKRATYIHKKINIKKSDGSED